MKNKLTYLLVFLMLLGFVNAAMTVTIAKPTDASTITTAELPYPANSSFTGYAEASCVTYIDGVSTCTNAHLLSGVTFTCDVNWGVPANYMGAHTINTTCTNSTNVGSHLHTFTLGWASTYSVLGLINITYDLTGTIILVLLGFAAAIIGIMLLVAITFSLKYIINTILSLVHGFKKK